MKRGISVIVSNLAEFAVFTGRDFVTMPGSTETVYQGPIYVGGSAYLTPTKDHTLKFIFDGSHVDEFGVPDAITDPKTYILKTSGNIFWYGPRAIGCDDRYNAPGECTADPITNFYESGINEVDVFGDPVFYYFLSNGETGGVQEATLKFMDKHALNFDTDPATENLVDLLGPTLARPLQVYLQDRLQSDLRYPHTTLYTDSATIYSINGAIVNPSSSFDGANPASQPLNEPHWENFRASNFDLASHALVEEQVPTQSLFLGGLEETHDLIEHAQEADSATQKEVKLHWIARNASGGGNLRGLAIDFRRMWCETDPTQNPWCSDPFFQLEEHPDLWEWDRHRPGGPATLYPNDNYFIRLLSHDDYNNLRDTPINLRKYNDERRKQTLNIIEVDIARLKYLIENGLRIDDVTPGDHYSNYDPFKDRFNDSSKPFVLYIGTQPETTDPWWQHPDWTSGTKKKSIHSELATVVRLINAEELPVAGLTIVSNSFIQVRGDYNTICPSGAGDICDPAGEACTMVPAAVIGDQIMALSDSWIDHDSTAGPGATYVNPADTFTYDSPRDGVGNLYMWADYRSHVVRSTLGEDAGGLHDTELEINAMLIGGDIPNQLIKTELSESQGGSEDDLYGFYRGNLTGLSSTLMRAGTNDTFAEGDTIANGQYDMSSPNPLPLPLTADDFKGLPVKLIIGYDPSTDMPIYDATSRTIGDVFGYADDGTCDACWANAGEVPPGSGNFVPDIPLYLKIGRNGIDDYDYLTSGIMNTAHLTTADMTTNQGRNVIKPGVRFAALAAYGKGFISDTYERYLWPSVSDDCCMPDVPFGCSAEVGDPEGPCAPCSGAVRVRCSDCQGLDNCTTDPDGLNECANNMECWDCNPPEYECGGECEQEMPKCGPSTITNCYYNSCSATLGCARSPVCGETIKPVLTNGSNFPPDNLQVIYTVGGHYRLRFAEFGDPQNKSATVKRRYLYVPQWNGVYSGGFENFIQYGEAWDEWGCACSLGVCTDCTKTGDKNTVKLFGALDILWESQTARKGQTYASTKAFYVSNTYNAPVRTISYSKELRYNEACQPPGLPDAIQLNIEGFRQD